MHHVVTHIHGEVENNKLILSFSRYWGSFSKHFMWHNKGCQIAWACRQTVAMDWLHAGWQKNYSNTYRRNNGGVCGQVLSAEGHFITPYVWNLVVDEVTEGIDRNGCYTMGVCVIFISGKFPNTVSQLIQEALSMEQQWCGKTQISHHPQKFQHLDQYLTSSSHLDEICKQDTELCSKCGAAKCMNMRDAKENNYTWSA
jgi:hypothetical protein